MLARILMIGFFVTLCIGWQLRIAVPATENPDYETYIVERDDTLTSVASDYGISVDTLAQANKLKPTDSLVPGQILVIPVNSQLAPQSPACLSPANTTATPATARTSSGDQVNGYVGSVSVARAEITAKPGGGRVLYSRAKRGTELLVIGQAGVCYAVLMSDGSIGWLPQASVALTNTQMTVDRPNPARAAQSDGGGSALINTAFEYMGIPYKLGGHLPNSLDCSLFVQVVFSRHGRKLPRTAAQQYGVGTPVDVADLQPGDRLYFYDRSGEIGHTAIYIGDGRFIHASSNRGCVAVDELSNLTYWKKYAGARR